MNDYILKIMIRERHEQIMEDFRGIRPLQQEWLRMTYRMKHLLSLFLPTGRKQNSNQPPSPDERSST